jgi:hypothetical protein
MNSLFFRLHVLIIHGPQSVLQALNASTIQGCKFDFSSLLGDASTVVAAARQIEQTGVGAYLGAANLIKDPHILTAAASIATIESRHNTVLNQFNKATAIPQAFDFPLGPPEVLAIVGPLITGCDLGITGTLSQHFIIFFLSELTAFSLRSANQPLTVTNTGPLIAGTQLTFQSPAFKSDKVSL